MCEIAGNSLELYSRLLDLELKFAIEKEDVLAAVQRGLRLVLAGPLLV